MSDERYFNDAPIAEPADDRFGVDSFAQALARGIRGIKSPVGATVALNGPWGSGKSSALNLIRHHLENKKDSDNLEIIDFKCWWFRGEEALTLAFLQELNASLAKNLGSKARELIPQLGKKLLQVGPVLGPIANYASGGILGPITKGTMDFGKKFFSDRESVEGLFQKLSQALEEQSKRFLILIDDIDRLTPDEALLVFRLVKSVGRLPNVIYLLVFDREIAERAVSEVYPSEGPHFLEKIIQASFDVPLPARDDLNAVAWAHIASLDGQMDYTDEAEEMRRFMNVYYDAISPYLNTPRDLTRLFNATEVSWPAVAGEVNLADYVALEVMRLFEPALYNAVRTSKDLVCGFDYGSGHKKQENQMKRFLDCVPERRREKAERSLGRLFPRLMNSNFASTSSGKSEVQRRVCSNKHFSIYFRMTLGDETMSTQEIGTFIDRCGDKNFVKQTLLNASKEIRKNDKSKVPLLFDEINIRATKIDNMHVPHLISAIFEIADDIYRDEDKEREFLQIGDSYLRIYWLIRRLTLERYSLDERSNVFLQACQHSQVGWLAHFACLASDDYERSKGPRLPHECLILEEHIDEFKKQALEAIVSIAANGALISHARFPWLLFRWRDFAGDGGEEVRHWLNDQLKDDSTFVILARAFTSETWSQGFGDRVAIRKIRLPLKDIALLVDLDEFRSRLENILDDSILDDEEQSTIRTFLEAWRQQESGDEFF